MGVTGVVSKTRQLAMTAVLSALYVIANFIPFSQFIGGAAFITAGVVMIPVIAVMLTPLYALMAGIICGLGISVFSIGLATVFPGYCILITTIAVLIGSIAFHYRFASWLPAVFLIAQGGFYVMYYNGAATPLWLTHYIIGIACSIAAFAYWKLKPGLVFSTAMLENAMMNIGSLVILNLPAELWIIIAPVSIAERIIATVGALLILGGLYKFAPNYFGARDEQ